MKRLFFASAILMLLAASMLAATGNNEVLVARDGTVFSVEVVSGEQLPEGTEAKTALRLRIDRGSDDVSSHLVPASLSGGRSWNPALAYDEQSETLFLFWVRAPQITTSELLVCSFTDGNFGEPTVLDGGLFRYRENLEIAVTRFGYDETANSLREAVAIHAIWWDTDGWDQRARYALLQIVNARAVVVDLRDAVELLPLNPAYGAATAASNPDVLKFPAISTGPMLDRAEVTFGDSRTNRIYRADLVPVISNGVLRPPIGIRRGEMPAPVFAVGTNSTITTITDPVDGESLLLYSVSNAKLQYLTFESGSWSEIRSIALDAHVNESAAVDALKRRLAGR